MKLFKRGKKGATAVSVIKGSDGPTSIFIASRFKGQRPSLLIKIKQKKILWKRARIMASLSAQPHTLDEVIAYIENKYHAIEKSCNDPQYKNEHDSLKASLIEQYSPHLAGPPITGLKPSHLTDQAAVEEYLGLLEKRSAAMASLPEDVFPMDFHYYVIQPNEARHINVCMEKLHDILNVGYQWNCKNAREPKRIMKDIYLYYGVTQEDIQNKTQRFELLVIILSQK